MGLYAILRISNISNAAYHVTSRHRVIYLFIYLFEWGMGNGYKCPTMHWVETV